MREDSRIPIILGRPFLATARAMIDVFNKKITLRVGSEEVIFDVDQSMKKPHTEDDECYGINDLDTVIQSATQELLENDHLNKNLEEGIDQPDYENCGSNSETPIRRAENLAADHLSRLENLNMGELSTEEIKDKFPDENLMILKTKVNDEEPWYADYVKYIVGKMVPPEWTPEKKKRFFSQVDYVSKWVEAQALPTNDAHVVEIFLKGLFARFEVPKALISDRGTHFCNSQLEKALLRYGVTHRISTAYHPQTNGQIKVTNRAIKRILERSVGYNLKDWSEKLNDALWALEPLTRHRT
ncbi:reverse transcriptase domain-containing protein [Tanacetum coccineum]